MYLEEGDVNEGGIEVDELKRKHFEGEALFIVRLCSGLLPIDEPYSNVFIDLKDK